MKKYNIGIYSDESDMPKGFDIYFNYLKFVTGEINGPILNSHNIISCFADNKTANLNSEWVAVSNNSKATRKEDQTLYCDWICPSNEEYQNYLFTLIKKVNNKKIAGIHLDSISIPNNNYCFCDKCISLINKSKLNYYEFRTRQTTEFVKKVSQITNKQLSVTLYPDPIHSERFGIDIDELSKIVEFFVIPLYDISYYTLYWIEILANAFAEKLRIPFMIAIYAKGVEINNLINTIRIIEKYTSNILISYDNGKACKINKILKKDSKENDENLP